MSTKAKTSGVPCRASSKSFENAVSPVIPASTPGSVPTVDGTIRRGSVASAKYDASSVPVPARGSSIRATARASFTSTVTGSLHGAARERVAAKLADRGPDVRQSTDALDDRNRGRLLAGERGLQAVADPDRSKSCGSARRPARPCSSAATVQDRRRRRESRDERPAQHAVERRPVPEAPAAGSPQAVQERYAGAVHLVPGFRAAPGVPGLRVEDGDRDDNHRRHREGAERRVAGEEHAGHRDHHGQAGDETARPEVAAAASSAALSPARPLVPRACASSRRASSRRDRASISSTTALTFSSTGQMTRQGEEAHGCDHGWSASSSGIPAATSAPKASTRTTSVTGSDSRPARSRSLADRLHDLLALRRGLAEAPDEQVGVSGLAPSTAATTGAILSAASSGSPRMSNRTTAERPSAETWSALARASWPALSSPLSMPRPVRRRPPRRQRRPGSSR